ncbi:MAG: hypothetical protein HXY50_05075 [Ignavibacteriaceae bacterium]|nr:hypothetical protein [Ignavibacteriaceae bacterium]
MKIPFIITSLFVLISFNSAQNLQVEKEYNSYYCVINGIEVFFTDENISLTKDNRSIYSENLSGKKIFKASPGQQYFFIGVFEFSAKKVDYPASIFVFNKEGKFEFRYNFYAPYDLPHPIFSLNDNGVLAAFDPLSFKVIIINNTVEQEVELEKELPFEMERASFIELNDNYLFVLSSKDVLDITENKSNVILYKVNLSDSKVEAKTLDYNTPTLLKITNNSILVSGIKFQDYKPFGKTIKYDFSFNELASNSLITEKIVFDGESIFGKYANRIFELNDDLSLAAEKEFPTDERIQDFQVFNNKLLVLTSSLLDSKLYSLRLDLITNFEEAMKNFRLAKIDEVTPSNNYLIIHHDMNSTKYKLSGN